MVDRTFDNPLAEKKFSFGKFSCIVFEFVVTPWEYVC